MNYKVSQDGFVLTKERLSWPVVPVFVVFFFSLFFTSTCDAKNLNVVEYYHTLHQHFYCTAEYVPTDCVRHLAVLQQLLNHYHAENLGEWSWVIISRREWKHSLEELGLPTLSPAMTSFVDRQTLLDEGLFSEDGERAGELEQHFHVPWQRMLMLALTHELGHAACRDGSEVRAEGFAEKLRNGVKPSCDALTW